MPASTTDQPNLLDPTSSQCAWSYTRVSERDESQWDVVEVVAVFDQVFTLQDYYLWTRMDFSKTKECTYSPNREYFCF